MNPLVQAELEQLRRLAQAHQAGNIDRFLEEQRRQKDRSKALERYRPYPKQMEFHNAGRDHRERMLMAPNQSGKTTAAAAETAMHLTGIYPDWFKGKRYDRPVAWMAASETGKLTRDGAQVHLCGAPKFAKGAGMIPSETIIDTPSGSSLKEAYDFIRVRHVSGGDSICYMRSYDQGSDRVQAMTLDGVWLDEEPEEQYYYECLARTSAVAGPVYTTLTPLKGMTKVVQKFIAERPPGTILIQMTLDDAEHYSPEQRATLIQSYPSYIREARAYGRPSKGSGVVYPVTDESIACDPLPIPSFWRQIGGLDLGGSGEEGHPTAAVKLAHDPEADIVYITATYRKKGGPIYEHAAALREWGADLPWAWPADALQHERKSGEQVKEMFLGHGLNMLSEFAQYEDGSTGLEASVEKIYERMLTGRWKVFRHLNDYFNEFGMYHRKEGVIVKQNDDIMDASRYAHMMLRFAESSRQHWEKEALNVQAEWV